MLQRPDSQWVCEIVTNVTFFTNLIPDNPIGTGDFFLPDYVLENKGLNALVCETCNSYRPPYQDNLCFFWVLARIRGSPLNNLDPHVEVLYNMYQNTLSKKAITRHFSGITIHQLYDIEQLFQININVFELFDRKARNDDKAKFDDVDEITIQNGEDDLS